jgi:hypothetical protein
MAVFGCTKEFAVTAHESLGIAVRG